MRLRLLPALLVALAATTSCVVTVPAVPKAGTVDDRVAVTGQPVKTPIIQSFTANPTNVTRGQTLTFQVVAFDPTNDALQFNWSATDGMLSTNTGRVVSWTPPAKPGVYTVSVIITNARGGAVTGSQNLTVAADGATSVVGQPTIVTPSPAPNATAAGAVGAASNTGTGAAEVIGAVVTTASPGISASPPMPATSTAASLAPTASSTPPLPPGTVDLPELTPIDPPTASPQPAPSMLPNMITCSGISYGSDPVMGLPTITKDDLHLDAPSPLGKTNSLFSMKVVSQSGTPYYYVISRIGQGRWNRHPVPGDGLVQSTVFEPGVYVLHFSTDADKAEFSTARFQRIFLKGCAEAICYLIPNTVPIQQSNWKSPDDTGDALKRYDGHLYIFKYDGSPSYLGRFDLP